MSGTTEIVVSRRNLIVGGAAIAAASTLPKIPARAQGPAKWRRYNVNSSTGQMMMGHYATAIKAMLKLPPSDARNWYRTAFVHYLDCPHGNWWLLPWHRAITGWMERMVRELSGFEQFAMPYWDWTADPSIPPIMQQGVLNPSNDAFIQKYSNFKAAMLPALNGTDYFTPGSPRNNELIQRPGSMATSDQLWAGIENTSEGATFFPWPNAYPNVRNPNPNLDCVAGPDVSAETVGKALSLQTFDTFASPPAANHSAFSGFGPLENYPHNNVHNNTGGVVAPGTVGNCNPNASTNTGGFMQAFLSPTDPLFFLHHSNLDRLWVAWTAQNAQNPNVLPVGAEFQNWASEPFLFFSDENGNYVSENQAGYYRNTDLFNYDYQPGTFGPNAAPAAALRGRPPVRRFASEVPPAAAARQLLPAAARAATAVRLQPGLIQATRGAAARTLFAKVTLALPHHRRGDMFRVMVHTGNPAGSVEAGHIRLFGHTGGHGLATFIIPIGDAVGQLARRGPLRANGFLHFRAVGPGDGGHHQLAARAEQEIPVHSVLVEAH